MSSARMSGAHFMITVILLRRRDPEAPQALFQVPHDADPVDELLPARPAEQGLPGRHQVKVGLGEQGVAGVVPFPQRPLKIGRAHV